MNKVRRLAEDLVTRYPDLFTGDFDKNKQALAQVSIVRTRSLRNQLAGAITKIIHKQRTEMGEQQVEPEQASIEERLGSETKAEDSQVQSSEQPTSNEATVSQPAA